MQDDVSIWSGEQQTVISQYQSALRACTAGIVEALEQRGHFASGILKAYEILDRLDQEELTVAAENKLLREALEHSIKSAIEASQSSSNWYKQALEDHFRMIGNNKGTQAATVLKRELIKDVVQEIGTEKRSAVARAAFAREGVVGDDGLFRSYEALYSFLTPFLFETIRKA